MSSRYYERDHRGALHSARRRMRGSMYNTLYLAVFSSRLWNILLDKVWVQIACEKLVLSRWRDGWKLNEHPSEKPLFILTALGRWSHVCQVLLLKSVSWEKAHGCLRPGFFHPSECTIDLKISPLRKEFLDCFCDGKENCKPQCVLVHTSFYWLTWTEITS